MMISKEQALQLVREAGFNVSKYCVSIDENYVLVDVAVMSKENLLKIEKALGAIDFEVCFNAHMEDVFVAYKMEELEIK